MSVPTPEYPSSLAFLRNWRPDGPWTLVAIDPNRKGITAKTFTKLEETELLDWVANQGKSRNVYFCVNPLTRSMTKKPERQDVENLSWLHVDVDPRPGEDLAKERERILALFTTSLPKGVPPPTYVVFSGGGYQGFWRLKQPVPIDGKPALYEDAKLYNLQLELLFQADSCHNVDRIMRLPGTLNRPDEKKRKKGRTEALAEVVSYVPGHVYDIAQFTKAPLVQAASSDGFSGAQVTVTVSGNVKRFASVDDIPGNLKDKLKVIIVQGHDPDDPHKFSGRSEWLFYACCEMIRSGCEDETIYSVITDPEFLISTSVLDKGTGTERYALRQIERAKEEAIDPWLRRLNEKHAVIGSHGGRCRIISEELDPVFNRSRIHFQSFGDFKNRYANKRVDIPMGNGKMNSMPLGIWWINHPQRREFETIVFAPGRQVEGAYNLWKGFAFEAKPGCCDRLLDHMRLNVCRGDETLNAYLLNWMALAVQKPDAPGHVAIVLRGRQGTGKGFAIKAFGKLFGCHFLPISDPKHLVGSFNSHLRDCVVLFGDEAFYAGDKKHQSVLKTLITEEHLTVEAKGVDVETAPNYVHLMMASNEEWVIPAGFDERRFFVLDVGTDEMQKASYFALINDELKSGGYEAFLHFLLTRDIANFNVRAIPQTAALQEQKEFSYSAEEEWWYSKLLNGEVFDGQGWPSYVFATELDWDYASYVRLWNAASKSSSTRLGRFMKLATPEAGELRAQLRGQHFVTQRDGSQRSVTRPRVYMLPSLEKCRIHWDRNFGGPKTWPSSNEVEVADATQDDTPF